MKMAHTTHLRVLTHYGTPDADNPCRRALLQIVWGNMHMSFFFPNFFLILARGWQGLTAGAVQIALTKKKDAIFNTLLNILLLFSQAGNCECFTPFAVHIFCARGRGNI